MTIGKAAAMTAALVGAVALGVAIGPSITHRDATTSTPAVEAPAPAPEPAAPKPAPKPRARAKAEKPTKPAITVALSEPALHDRLKPVLNRGSNMTLASAGFRDAEQFATVAHAARNTNVPFVLLKHRVVNEGKTLAQALRESKPDLRVENEVARAVSEARRDLAEVADQSAVAGPA